MNGHFTSLLNPTQMSCNTPDLSGFGVCGCVPTAEHHLLLQIPSAMLLSLAYGGNMFRSALGTFAAMLNIYKTAAVADTIPVPIWMRCIAAVFTVTGAIVGGARLMPVTGGTCPADTSPEVISAVSCPCGIQGQGAKLGSN